MTWLEFKKKLSLCPLNDRFYEILYRYDNDGIDIKYTKKGITFKGYITEEYHNWKKYMNDIDISFSICHIFEEKISQNLRIISLGKTFLTLGEMIETLDPFINNYDIIFAIIIDNFIDIDFQSKFNYYLTSELWYSIFDNNIYIMLILVPDENLLPK